MAAPKRLTNGQIERALRNNAGIVSMAAQELGVTRQALHYRLHRSPALREVQVEMEETVGDLCEASIFALMRAKDGPTLRWYADRRLRHRGYGNELVVRPEVIDALVNSILDRIGPDPQLRLAALRELEAMI